MDSRHAGFGLLLCASCVAFGCASTIHAAAKQAAPAAVEGTVQAAKNPETRRGLAEVLADPHLRQASTELSQAVAAGVLDALAGRAEKARMLESSDAFVEHMSHTLALSIRRDLGPAIGDVAAVSVQRGLDAVTEERLEMMARALARGAIEGVADGSDAHLRGAGPAVDDAVKKVVRDAAREAALGMQDAVAESTARQKAGKGEAGAVLAAAGVTSDSLLTALRGVGWALVVAGALLALAIVAGVVRHFARFRHPPTRTVHP